MHSKIYLKLNFGSEVRLNIKL